MGNVDIIQSIGSPALKAIFDVGNPLPVGEDMYEAAERMAPHTVTVHFKDWNVVPLTFFGAKIIGAPLGQGVINLPRVVEILENRVPDPENLRMNVEVMWEAGDEDKAVVESMIYAKKLLSKIAGTYRSGEVKAYVNGVVEAETEDITGKYLVTNGDVWIEKYWGGGCDDFDGSIDDVGIFNKVLTEGDINSIMNNGLEEAGSAVLPSGKLTSTWGRPKHL